ncbi:hypothetical protein JAAARDRAFT_33384 [Jaapia argillacea MUCL 33604]|uniref:Fungal-type protein kinase domain-containing protein n=1 Tax=Jaapia argillacea MUCL 33604 TaxID=933084 RepID=A0A067Q8H0_9AGAM|nr:hypothetical protein JAAARDRAFT_33384 [Jaapia argillacea MUCL 33604]
MRLHFVPVTVEAFLAEWFPPPAGVSDESIPDFHGAFTTMVANVAEEQMYKAFIKCVEARGLCPNLTLRETPHRAESSDPKGIKVDLCVFEESHVYGAGKENTQDWGNQVMHGEFKNLKGATSGDPFDDTRATAPPKPDDPFSPFESGALSRRDARGQIVSYAAELALRQHRVFFFTFMILGFEARLIRWDRAGTIVTNRFNYQTRPELAIFLWRFSQLSPLDRGYDPTATRISFEDPLVKQAITNQLDERKDYVRKMFQEDIREGWPLYQLTVGRAADTGPSTTIDGQGPSTTIVKKFIVGRPHFRDGGVVGRATRGYVALNVETKEFVWLKDVWRIDGLHKEGDVIQEMNEANIPHVPTLVCHGDVEDQKTRTNTRWPHKDPPPNPMRGFTHYRLVVKEVGRPLAEFENGRDLVGILSDCLLAHQGAYEKLSILHRDVSDGNILIIPGSGRDEGEGIVNRGMLNDWDLCKKISKGKEGAGSVLARARDRTGTWAFMSAGLLQDGTKPALLQDDLESFFHVLLFNGVKFLKNNCQDVPGFISHFFESYSYQGEVCVGGQSKQTAFTANKLVYPVKAPALAFESTPLNTLITMLLGWFHTYYEVEDDRTKARQQLAAEQPDHPLSPTSASGPLLNLPEEEIRMLAAVKEFHAKTFAINEKLALVNLASHLRANEAFAACRKLQGWVDDKVADQSVYKTTGSGRGVKRGSQYTIGDGSPTGKLSKRSQSIFSSRPEAAVREEEEEDEEREQERERARARAPEEEEEEDE